MPKDRSQAGEAPEFLNTPEFANAPKFVNTWKPVTDEYQHTDVPSLDAPMPPPAAKAPAAPVKERQRPKLPIAIACLAWFYLIRAAVYLVFAMILSAQPGSELGVLLIGHSRLLVPFEMHRTHGQVPVGLFAEALFATAVLSVVVGVMWLARSWRIRWITMFYAGASAARTMFYLLTGAAAGLAGGALSPDQKQAMLAGCAVNILIFCYLAFYPGVEQAFEDRL
ncbi:MAG TPA: hypothetical protein VHX20_12425 [Terracidiphilus sp.]|jgi:hypothetical protein|nr:hypothetical protein [Terracidiphilus sp.]